MTNEEFKSEITTLSPKIATLVARRTGPRIGAELGSLGQTFTSAPDFDTAVNILKSDPAKLSAFEGIVATAATVAASSPAPGNPTSYSWVSTLSSSIILIGFSTLAGEL